MSLCVVRNNNLNPILANGSTEEIRVNKTPLLSMQSKNLAKRNC